MHTIQPAALVMPLRFSAPSPKFESRSNGDIP
jgi:hypothetical protein